MDALVKRETKLSVSSTDCAFLPLQPWMRISLGEILGTKERLYHYILNAVMSKWNMTELEIVDRKMDTVEEFPGMLDISWTCRRNGVRSDGTYLIEFFVCEDAKPDRPFVRGNLAVRET
jgi:hypothetical protein